MRSLRNSLLVFGIAFALSAGTARAEPEGWVFEDDETHPFDLSIVGTFGWLIGGGVIAGIPVAPNGFGPDINDAFYIEIEGGAGGWPGFSWAGYAYVMGGVRYQLYLLEWFAPYICGRGGAYLPFVPGDRVRPAGYGAFGVMFLPNENIAFRIEGGYGGRVGVTFRF